MKLPKDIYLYLTNFADDKTIFNMLSVNKKYNNDKFFEQVMRNKYPLLVQYNQSKEGWKKFFAIMAYCIAKIERTYNIPYYHVKEHDPRNYYYASKEVILNGIMRLAAKDGQIVLVKLMIEKGSDNFNETMAMAAYGGHIDIVKLMIKEGATGLNRAMIEAAKGGHKNIIELMIQYGADDFDWAMTGAAKGGHKDIIDFMIQHGATDFVWTMRVAAGYGNSDIVDYLKTL